jgi:hypothetical protein
MTGRHRIRIRYEGGRTIVVKGPFTGREYRFSGTDRVLLVDPRDAVGMAKPGILSVAGVVELDES